MIKTLLKCMDLLTLPLGFAGVFAGSAAAALAGNCQIMPASLCFMFVLFLLPAANVGHRYFDIKNHYGQASEEYVNYRQNEIRMPLQSLLKEAMNSLFIPAALFGLSIIAVGGYWSLLIGVLILAIFYFNSAGMKPLSHSPINYFVCWFVFGPLCAFSTFLVQFEHSNSVELDTHHTLPALLIACATGLLAASSLMLYNMYTYKGQRHIGFNTFVNVIGVKAARWWVGLTGLAALGLTYAAAAMCKFPTGGMLLLPPAVCALLTAYVAIKYGTDDPKGIRMQFYLINYGALFYGVGEFVICLIFGRPSTGINVFF